MDARLHREARAAGLLSPISGKREEQGIRGCEVEAGQDKHGV